MYKRQVQALKRRYMEIHISDFLILAGLELKPKFELDKLKGEQIEDFMTLFNKVGPNRIQGYGEEGYISIQANVQSEDEDFIDIDTCDE